MTHTPLLDPNLDSTQTAPRANLPPESVEQLEQVMQQDRNFFLQHPERDYYVRPITPVEILEGQAMGKAVSETARVLVGEVAPGSRVRLTIIDQHEPLPLEKFRALQQQLRKQLGTKSPTLKDRLRNRKSRPQAKGFG